MDKKANNQKCIKEIPALPKKKVLANIDSQSAAILAGNSALESRGSHKTGESSL